HLVSAKSLDPAGDRGLVSQSLGDRHISRAESRMHPALAVGLESHDLRAGHSLREQSGLRPKVGVDFEIPEPSPPAPLTTWRERLRVATIVVIEQRGAERGWRAPFEPAIESGAMINLDEGPRLV